MKTELHTLGVWYGFPQPLGIKREGIGRFTFYLIKHLLKNRQVNCEIWCYRINRAEIEELFEPLLSDVFYRGRISFLDEQGLETSGTTWRAAFRAGWSDIASILLCNHQLHWRQGWATYRSLHPVADEKGGIREFFLMSRDRASQFLLLGLGAFSRALRKVFLKNSFIVNNPGIIEFIGVSALDGETGHVHGDWKVAQKGRPGFFVNIPLPQLQKGRWRLSMKYRGDGKSENAIARWEVVYGNQVVASDSIMPSRKGLIDCVLLIDDSLVIFPAVFRIQYYGEGELEVGALSIRVLWSMPPDRLVEIANMTSRAECFYIPIVSLSNALALRRPRVIALHDLFPVVFSQLFESEGNASREYLEALIRTAYAFAFQRCLFVSNSEYIMKEHVQKFVPCIDPRQTRFVYVPANVPSGLEEKVAAFEVLEKKYQVRRPYLVYPSQIRPHKNVLTLLKALVVLRERGIDIRLVLTGRPADVPSVHRYMEESGISSRLILTADLAEMELYALYKHALAAVVPTLGEGGFPWQGLEAMLMDTPAIMSRIPVTLERLRHEGFDPEACGLLLFDPSDPEELVERILTVFKDREKAVRDQQAVSVKLLSYTWDDLGAQYYSFMSELVAHGGDVNPDDT